jgi:hypothetical protein
MGEQAQRLLRKVTFNLTPFGAAEAQDFYANVTGVGTTPSEVIVAFGQLLPDARVSNLDVIEIAPKVRVSMPAATARVLLQQLGQQLEQREAFEREVSKHGESDGSAPQQA